MLNAGKWARWWLRCHAHSLVASFNQISRRCFGWMKQQCHCVWVNTFSNIIYRAWIPWSVWSAGTTDLLSGSSAQWSSKESRMVDFYSVSASLNPMTLFMWLYAQWLTTWRMFQPAGRSGDSNWLFKKCTVSASIRCGNDAISLM